MIQPSFKLAWFLIFYSSSNAIAQNSRWGDRCVAPAPKISADGWARVVFPSHGNLVSCNLKTRFEMHFDGNTTSVALIFDGNPMGALFLRTGLITSAFIDIGKEPGPSLHVVELESVDGFILDRVEFLLEFAEVEPLGCSRSSSIVDPDVLPEWHIVPDYSAYGDDERRIFSQAPPTTCIFAFAQVLSQATPAPPP
jgi:hypothetical protein